MVLLGGDLASGRSWQAINVRGWMHEKWDHGDKVSDNIMNV